MCRNGGLKSNVSGDGPVKTSSMEMIKALIALLLTAVVVFSAVLFYNDRTIPAYEAKIIKANLAGAAMIAKQTAIEKRTNVVVRQKIKNSNL